jgi:nitrogen regulatory protein PII
MEMKPVHEVKRVEIIASSVELGKIIEGLKKSQIQGYTVIENVSSQNSRGEASDDLDTNVCVIAFCLPDRIKTLVENIKPILNKFGGTCYISDAMEIRSVRCVASM